jgi:hypothetical protein
MKWHEVRENSTVRSFIICVIYQMKYVGHVACTREMKNVYKIFVRKPEGKRPLGRLRYAYDVDLFKFITICNVCTKLQH